MARQPQRGWAKLGGFFFGSNWMCLRNTRRCCLC